MVVPQVAMLPKFAPALQNDVFWTGKTTAFVDPRQPRLLTKELYRSTQPAFYHEGRGIPEFSSFAEELGQLMTSGEESFLRGCGP